MGVEKEVVRPGSGPKPVAGQNVTVHCTGYGQVKIVTSLKSSGVQKILDKNLFHLRLAKDLSLKCSPDYAYGRNGFPDWGIQPESELIFEIEVLSLQ
ncbi:peptidyl-prolyl cis-trans isomerase FKBP12 isoform X3 [Amborella trichopoda]|uniref:peptidyl-prolyl cis-trans isomerase FKBP12 isoform X3 n=1 Tax=Amborella trichopoda TaxID=13333 RepID=UPI0009BEF21B|nr:peptidyl-prolyl cis-trans isomerase FKBP12 isoform X3 [Amborella trichopoda]|eukprot:XP_020520977.1 peptidyl-prolyl cis-trans isomerase FKBP12 isoform X3 [Amborella trichopoda]